MNLICLHLFQEDFQVNNCLSLVMSTVLLVMADVMMIKTMVMKNRLIWIATNSGWKWLSFLCLVIVHIVHWTQKTQTGLHSLYTQTVHIFESNKTNRPRYTPKWRQNSVSSILVERQTCSHICYVQPMNITRNMLSMAEWTGSWCILVPCVLALTFIVVQLINIG